MINPLSRRILGILLGILLFNVPLLAQTGDMASQVELSSLRGKLLSIGLSDVRVDQGSEETSTDSSVLRVAFENRAFHSEAAAIGAALRVIADPVNGLQDSHTVMLFVQHQRAPVVVVRTSISSLRNRIAGSLSHDEWLQDAEIVFYDQVVHGEVPQQGRQWQGAELRFGIGMRYQLGDYYDPWLFAFDFEPELRIPFGRGWFVSARAAIPMYNNLDQKKTVRPSLFTLNYFSLLDAGLYGGVSGGFFSRNRLGVHGKIQAFVYEEVISVTLDAGYTTFTDITGKVQFQYLEDRNFSTFSAGIAHRWQQYDLNTSVRYGNFLYYDSGVIAETYRQFGNLVIGFFYMDTRIGDNFGFRFDIPLQPKKAIKAGPIWVGTQTHFSFRYRYKGGLLDGREFETGLYSFDIVRQLYPSFLSKELKNNL